MFYVLAFHVVVFGLIGFWALRSRRDKQILVEVQDLAPVVFRPEDAMNISADIMEQTDVFSFGDDPDFAQDSFSGVDLGIFKASVGDEVGRLRAAIREDESNHTLAVASRPVSSNSYFMVPQSR